MNLSNRETATVLAALRLFQQQPDMVRDHFAEGIKPLSLKQIDSLCERINTDHEPHVLKKPLGNRFKRHCNEEGYLTVVVPIDFNEVLGNDVEGLDDILDGLILGDDVSGSLSDISWRPVGAKNGQVLLEVTAKPEGIYD